MKPRNTPDKRKGTIQRGFENSEFFKELHDPDNGLYARIRDQQQTIEFMSPRVEENEKEIVELKNKLNKTVTTLNEIVAWKNKMAAAYKWVLVTLAAGSIGVCFKLVYDVLKILVIK